MLLPVSVPIFKELAVVANLATGKKSTQPLHLRMSSTHKEIFEPTELTEYIIVCQFPSIKFPWYL